jgi:hypothetical protein
MTADAARGERASFSFFVPPCRGAERGRGREPCIHAWGARSDSGDTIGCADVGASGRRVRAIRLRRGGGRVLVAAMSAAGRAPDAEFLRSARRRPRVDGPERGRGAVFRCFFTQGARRPPTGRRLDRRAARGRDRRVLDDRPSAQFPTRRNAGQPIAAGPGNGVRIALAALAQATPTHRCRPMKSGSARPDDDAGPKGARELRASVGVRDGTARRARRSPRGGARCSRWCASSARVTGDPDMLAGVRSGRARRRRVARRDFRATALLGPLPL